MKQDRMFNINQGGLGVLNLEVENKPFLLKKSPLILQ
jgi:hypothetical protein